MARGWWAYLFCPALAWRLADIVHRRSICGSSGHSSSDSGASLPCLLGCSKFVVTLGVVGVSIGKGDETTLDCSVVFFSSRLSLKTSTLALKYSSRQSSNLTAFPSVSGGTPRFNSLSYTTLWSASSPLPWWNRSTLRVRRGSCRVSVMKAKVSDVSCCSRAFASVHPHAAKAS